MSTTVPSFIEQLKAANVSAGATYGKADFHVHYPGVDDYEYKAADACAQLSKQLTDLEYRYAVVLRHQQFPSKQELEQLQQLCPNTCLVPGAELNVFVDALGKKVNKDYYFHCIIAVDPAKPDDFNYLLTKAREKLTYEDTGSYPSGFRSNIVDVAHFFRDEGSLFIPAHLHQCKAPENSRSIDDVYDDDAFLGFVNRDLFTALEVREISTASFFRGSARTKEGHLIPHAVCVQSSDAHHHEHIAARHRCTWIQTEGNSYAELEAAMSFPHRVRLERPATSHTRIVAVHVVGAFLKDVWVAFNPSMNFLIGCKGSGKTSILECLRFVLNTPVPKERREAVQQHINHILGSAGYIECLVQRSDGSKAVLTRRADSMDRIRIVEEDGVVSELASGDRVPFESAILGWHEIEAVADQPGARMTLIDRVEGEVQILQLYRDVNAKVEVARDLLPSLHRSLKRLNEQLRRLWDLQNKRATLAKLEEGAMLELQRQYEAFVSAEAKHRAARNQLPTSLQQAIVGDTNAFRQLSAPIEIPQNAPAPVAKALAALQTNLASIVDTRSEFTEGLSAKVSAATAALDGELAAAVSAFQAFREQEYAQKVNALSPDEQVILSSCIKIIEETRHLGEVEMTCKTLQDEVQGLAAMIYDHCDAICKARDQICGIRANTVEKINSQIQNVKITFQRSANHSSRNEFLSRYQQD